MKIKITSLIILSIIIVGCSINLKEQSKNNIYKYQINKKQIDSINQLWLLDSTGCNKVRTFGMCKQIVYYHNLLDKNNDSINFYLGPPNKIVSKNEWRYNVQCSCDLNGNCIDSLDYCWVTIKFKSKMEVLDVLYICN